MKAGLSLFLLAVLFSAAPQALHAVEVNLSAGSRHHGRDGGVGLSFRTGDPTYSTWYPNSTTTTTYNYSSPYSTTTTTTYNTPSYTYRTPSPSFGVWFGGDRYRDHRRDYYYSDRRHRR